MPWSLRDKPGQARPGQARPGQARPGQARPGQARPGQARPGQEQLSSVFCVDENICAYIYVAIYYYKQCAWYRSKFLMKIYIILITNVVGTSAIQHQIKSHNSWFYINKCLNAKGK